MHGSILNLSPVIGRPGSFIWSLRGFAKQPPRSHFVAVCCGNGNSRPWLTHDRRVALCDETSFRFLPFITWWRINILDVASGLIVSWLVATIKGDAKLCTAFLFRPSFCDFTMDWRASVSMWMNCTSVTSIWINDTYVWWIIPCKQWLRRKIFSYPSRGWTSTLR